jgi:DNA polymerase III delta prime subunit
LSTATSDENLYSYLQRIKWTNETMQYCYDGDIQLEEIEDHEYLLNESLLNEKSNNQVLMSRMNNFMPNFVDNLLQIAGTDLD